MSRMGSEIARLRKDIGMTVQQLAKSIGVSEKFIIDVESGKRVINEDLISKINKVLRQTAGKLDLYEVEERRQIPEPLKNVVKVIEKPVQEIWNDALSGVIQDIPVYDYSLEKTLSTRQLPVLSNKVEGYPRDKVLYIRVEDNDMSGFRIFKDAQIFGISTKEIERDGIFFIEYNGKRVIRQLKKMSSDRFVLVNNNGNLKTETATAKEVTILALLIRAEITL